MHHFFFQHELGTHVPCSPTIQQRPASYQNFQCYVVVWKLIKNFWVLIDHIITRLYVGMSWGGGQGESGGQRPFRKRSWLFLLCSLPSYEPAPHPQNLLQLRLCSELYTTARLKSFCFSLIYILNNTLYNYTIFFFSSS